MSVGPITHAQITAWSDGMNIFVTPFERTAILAIDEAYILSTFKDKESK